jgi:hypothetical protein
MGVPLMSAIFQSKWFLLVALVLAALIQWNLAGAALQPIELAGFSPGGAGADALWIQRIFVERAPPLCVLFDSLGHAHPSRPEWVLRLPSMLLGLSSIVLIYALGTRFLNRRVALIAALLLALSPVQLWYATQAGSSLLPMVLAMGATLAFYRLGAGSSTGAGGLLYGLLGAGLTLSHAYGIVFVVSFSLLALIARLPDGLRVHAWGVLSLLLWAVQRWALVGGEGMALGAGSAGGVSLADWQGLYLNWLAGGRSLDPLLAGDEGFWASLRPGLLLGWQALTGLLVLRGLVNLVRSQRLGRAGLEGTHQRQPISAHLLLLIVVLPTCMLLGSFAGGPNSVLPSELLPALPFFLLAVAAGLMVERGARSQALFALALGILFKLDLVAFALQPGAWMVDEPRADWYSAAAYLDEELADKTKAREVYVAYADPRALLHYSPELERKAWRSRVAELTLNMTSSALPQWARERGMASVDALEAKLDEAWDARGLSVLDIAADPLRRSGPSSRHKLPFYVIFKQHPGQDFYRLHPVLPPALAGPAKLAGDPTLKSDPGQSASLEIAAELHLDSLVIFKLKWAR